MHKPRATQTTSTQDTGIRAGEELEVKIGISCYQAKVIAVDWLGNKIKLGWIPGDEAYGDESWWNMAEIEIRRRGE